MPFTAPTGGVVSGVPVLIGGLLAVPATDKAETLVFDGRVTGVFRYTKTASQAWTEGQKIYWDTRAVGSGGQRFTSDGTQGPLVGVSAEVVAGGAGDTEGEVRLNGAASALLEGGPQAAVTDLAGTLTGTVDGTMVDVAASAAATAGGATPSAAQVDTGIATAVATIVTGVNTQNKEVLTKINALLAALRLAGIIA